LVNALENLEEELEGTLEWDALHQSLYATDASVYYIKPLAVAFPKNVTDIQKLIAFAQFNKTSLIPRTAGTSLAGQCVGKGIVVDVSKHFTDILYLDKQNRTVKVQPGVNRDALNVFLARHGLFFGPNTSTSKYCMLGGMVGNNSSGTTSIKYGVTRDSLLCIEAILSDGSFVTFKDCTELERKNKIKEDTLEGYIYRVIAEELVKPEINKNILNDFPEASIHRRNTGYALDVLIKQKPFSKKGDSFNIAKLLAGSEGTLAFTTSITLSLDSLPPKENVMLVVHFESIQKAMLSVIPAMEHPLFTCELIDKTILDCTKDHLGYKKNRFFLKDDPKAILLLELRNDNIDELKLALRKLKETIESSNLSYANVPLWGEEIDLANELRNAGLGLLGNIVGDSKAVACIEDTAVPLDKLATYIEEFQKLMKTFDQEVVYYAHAGAGELHLRPILNLKSKKGIQDFRAITLAVAYLVKKYKGSLSGEHGDGIVRSEFIPIVLGEANYDLIKKIKKSFDPNNIFNPGKIVDALPMDQNLRTHKSKTPAFDTIFDFSEDQGILRSSEKCNGAGKCLSVEPSGTMCPSYRATRDEKHNTRGRANVLRDVLNRNKTPNAFDSKELKEVFDLCLSCKACATECPSSVDVATFKAEFLYQYKKTHGVRLRDRLFAFNGYLNKKTQPLRFFQNLLFQSSLISRLLKKILGISSKRSIPIIHKSLYKTLVNKPLNKPLKTVYLYLDEFTNYLDNSIGNDTLMLLNELNYNVKLLPPSESGRAYISKGFLEEAKACAEHNIDLYSSKISEETPLIGIEPSAIYTFVDEYPKISNQKEKAKALAKNCFLIDSFLANEVKKGNISKDQFHNENKQIKIHSHCYQKALGTPADTFTILNLPLNYNVRMLNTGCCGMAGSFGYETEHYKTSQQVGEERLFPSVRSCNPETLIAANGTSCRHQIYDGTSRQASHPVTLLKNAIIKTSID